MKTYRELHTVLECLHADMIDKLNTIVAEYFKEEGIYDLAWAIGDDRPAKEAFSEDIVRFADIVNQINKTMATLDQFASEQDRWEAKRNIQKAAETMLPPETIEVRCSHGMFLSGAGACPSCAADGPDTSDVDPE